MKKYILKTNKLESTLLIMLIFFGLMPCISCSNDLSRGKAKDILGKKKVVIGREIPFKLIDPIYKAPIHRVIRESQMPTVQRVPSDREQKKVLMEKLRDGGYVDLEKNKIDGRDYLIISPKNKLKPYIFKRDEDEFEIFIAEVKIDEITGITQVPMDTSVREVEYKIKIVPNELSNIFILTEDEKTDTTRRAYIRKYDDGWRMENSD